MITFQEMIRRLADFWVKQGCVVHQGYDLELGAGTANPATFLRSLGLSLTKRFTLSLAAAPLTAATARIRRGCSTTFNARSS